MSSQEDFEQPAIFKKSMKDVNTESLTGLFQVEEGWFVEFKSNLPDTSKIAKSISSFANAYGGIIIYGAVEDQKTRKLKEFAGFSLQDAEKYLLAIRQAVEHHIEPCPYYEAKIVKLEDNNDCEYYLIWVKVPKGHYVPYLHSSGVIYTRKGDSSSPTSLTNISVLERLWQDGYRSKEEFSKRIKYILSQIKDNSPSLDIFIRSEGAGSSNTEIDVSFDDFKRIALESNIPGKVSFFDIVHPMDGSFIARSRVGNLTHTGILWEYDKKRSLHHIHVPLAVQSWNGSSLEKKNLGWERLSKLSEYLIKQKYTENLFIVDMTFSLGILFHTINNVFRLSKECGLDDNLFFNAKVSGVKNSMIVVNYNKYYEELDKSIFPYIFRDPDFIYPLDAPSTWLKLTNELIKVEELGFEMDIASTTAIFIKICYYLGITFYATMGAGGINNDDEIDSSELVQNLMDLVSNNYSYSLSRNPVYKDE